jgi:hypothetical protein
VAIAISSDVYEHLEGVGEVGGIIGERTNDMHNPILIKLFPPDRCVGQWLIPLPGWRGQYNISVRILHFYIQFSTQ